MNKRPSTKEWDKELKELDKEFNFLDSEKKILNEAFMEDVILGQSGIEIQSGKITRLLTQEEIWKIKK